MIDLTQRTESVDVRKIKWIKGIDINKVFDLIIANYGREGTSHDEIVDLAKEMIRPARRQKINRQRRPGGDVDQVGVIFVNPPVSIETKKKRHRSDPDRFGAQTGDDVFQGERVVNVENPVVT